ncbi:MAG: Hsp20 family protein [Chromatiales bacterium]|jgi:molecular chaperone IbpA
MTTFDFTPLFRSAIGFDRLTNALENAYRSDNNSGYPPYNIELIDEDSYRITMAVAGFKQDELDIEVKNGRLTVSGAQSDDRKDRQYLHHGIANRSFERSFQLADHVEVRGAKLSDGLLHIELVRVIPEALKPRKIAISNEVQSADDKLIENQSDSEVQAA